MYGANKFPHFQIRLAQLSSETENVICYKGKFTVRGCAKRDNFSTLTSMSLHLNQLRGLCFIDSESRSHFPK